MRVYDKYNHYSILASPHAILNLPIKSHLEMHVSYSLTAPLQVILIVFCMVGSKGTTVQ